ncbi:hypothetical protein DW963_10195 [Eubacterium sp. AM46-8]|nr:hypothetical protein DW963_10195 [Eubacterium sp. AM46-8]
MYQAGFFFVMDCSFYYGGKVDFLVGMEGEMWLCGVFWGDYIALLFIYCWMYRVTAVSPV